MDANDMTLIAHLQHDGRATWAALGARLGVTGPAAAERVRKLEEQGVIRGFTAIVNPDALGLVLTAFVAVTLERPQHRDEFLERVRELGEVLECHHVAGDDDFLLKVRARGPLDLDRILSQELKSIPGVGRTRTTIVLSTAKETSALPVEA